MMPPATLKASRPDTKVYIGFSCFLGFASLLIMSFHFLVFKVKCVIFGEEMECLQFRSQDLSLPPPPEITSWLQWPAAVTLNCERPYKYVSMQDSI